MFKNSAVVGAFGVGGDLWSTGQTLTSARGYATLPVFVGVAVGYLAHHAAGRGAAAGHRAEGGDRPMSQQTVLYDAQGPRARRRTLIGTVDRRAGPRSAWPTSSSGGWPSEGQFSMEKWGPLIDPGNEAFDAVWRLLGEGVVNTLKAAAVAMVLSDRARHADRRGPALRSAGSAGSR